MGQAGDAGGRSWRGCAGLGRSCKARRVIPVPASTSPTLATTGLRERITIYEVPVPAPGSTSTKPASAFHARYPDRPHDAEALLATRQAGIFIITKEASPRVYRFAVSQNPGETSTLAFVRTLNEKERITGAAASPDGRWVALRSNGTLLVYTLDDFVKARNPVRVDLRSFKEPQGEGVAFGRSGEIYFVSEGGRGNASGMLTRIHCASFSNRYNSSP